MRFDPAALPEPVLGFLAERHLATLTTLSAAGAPHVVPVGFSYDAGAGLARIITSGGSVKARHAARPGAVAALCQVDCARWVTLSGPVRVETAHAAVAEAERRYAARYRPPRVNPKRVVLLIEVSDAIGTVRNSPP